MNHITKATSLILAIGCLAVLLGTLFLDIHSINSFFGTDIERIPFLCHNGVEYFSLPKAYPFLWLALTLLFVIAVVIAIYTKQFVRYVKSFFSLLKNNTLAIFNEIKNSNLKYILLFSGLCYFYFAITTPITHDEAATYTYFINCPFFTTIGWYPFPNNHILFSIFGQISTKIPFLDLLLAVRLPSIICSLITWAIVFRFVKKYYSENTAMLVTAIGSMLMMTVQYSIFARGYSMLLLFVVISLYAAYNIVKEGSQLKDWAIFTLSSILGLYTVPTFVYPFITINLFILCYTYKNLPRQIFFNILVCIAVFILYTPVFAMMGGIDALADNKFVQPLSRSYVFGYMPIFIISIFTDTFGTLHYITMPIAALCVLYAILKKDKQTVLLWALFGIVPVVLIVIQSVVPFLRNFAYYGFVLPFLIGITFNSQLKKANLKYLFAALIVCQIALAINFKSKIDYITMMFGEFSDLTPKIMDDNKTYFLNCDFVPPNLEFELERNHLQAKKIVISQDSLTNADTLHGFDYILIDAHRDKTIEKKPYQNAEGALKKPINIYRDN